MSWEDERIGPDVSFAGRLVNDYISRGCYTSPDLEEALEASRYSSHPYSSPHKETHKELKEMVNTLSLEKSRLKKEEEQLMKAYQELQDWNYYLKS